MKTERILGPILLVLLVHFGIAGAGLPSVRANELQEFERELEGLRRWLRIPGMSVAVLHRQSVVFAQGFGHADLEAKIPATENTPYNIASCTKPFASVVLMKLVEQGQLDLDTPMVEILKDTEFSFRSDTIRGYRNMCDALTEFAPKQFDYHGKTNPITVRHHLSHTSQGVAGDEFRYNTFFYNWLSLVAEEASGTPYADLIVQHIIAPLEMTNTIPSPSAATRDRVLAERAKYYWFNESGRYETLSSPSADQINAGSGMISTVLDLAKFDVAIDRNAIVSEASHDSMFTPTVSNHGQPLPYGLGWFVQVFGDVKLVWHYGLTSRCSSLWLKVPEKEVTLIMLANCNRATAPFHRQMIEGNVIASPFAVMFLEQLAGIAFE